MYYVLSLALLLGLIQDLPNLTLTLALTLTLSLLQPSGLTLSLMRRRSTAICASIFMRPITITPAPTIIMAPPELLKAPRAVRPRARDSAIIRQGKQGHIMTPLPWLQPQQPSPLTLYPYHVATGSSYHILALTLTLTFSTTPGADAVRAVPTRDPTALAVVVSCAGLYLPLARALPLAAFPPTVTLTVTLTLTLHSNPLP